MSKDRYIHLLEEFCRLSKLDAPARIAEGGAIEFDDIPFSLLYSEKINPGALLVYGEFGALPHGQEAEALRILLQQNLLRYDGDGGPAFSMSAAGKILSAHRLLLADAKAQQLADLLSDIAEKAKQWRKDYRIGTQPSSATPFRHQHRPARFAAAQPQQAFVKQDGSAIAAKRVRHGAPPPPITLRELEEGHESQARAGNVSGHIHETPTGLRMRASLSREIGKSVTPD